MTLQAKTIKCAACGKSWPAPGPTDRYDTHPSVVHANVRCDDWRFV
jgi:hypothetical protein